jgi:hypothetical protein
VYDPADDAFVSPPNVSVAVVPAPTQPAENEYVSVFEARVTLPPLGTPEILVTVGDPVVPGGTVIVTLFTFAPLPVLKL